MRLTLHTRSMRIVSNFLAPIFAIKPAFDWYFGIFGMPDDPFVPNPEPVVTAPPLAIEWMVAISVFVTGQFIFAVLVIFCAWFGFQKILDTHEMVLAMKRASEE